MSLRTKIFVKGKTEWSNRSKMYKAKINVRHLISLVKQYH